MPLHRAPAAEGGKGPRTAIGLSADRRRAWIVVVDGREKGHSTGADHAALVAPFRELCASDAMGFDGGGLSTLAIADNKGAVVCSLRWRLRANRVIAARSSGLHAPGPTPASGSKRYLGEAGLANGPDTRLMRVPMRTNAPVRCRSPTNLANAARRARPDHHPIIGASTSVRLTICPRKRGPKAAPAKLCCD